MFFWRYIKVLFLFLVLVLLVAGCRDNGNNVSGNLTPDASSDTIKVALVTDAAGLGDQSFNDSAYQGLLKAENELGVEKQVIESSSMIDYVPNLSSLANLKYNLIFSIGFLTKDSLAEVAELYPETHFGLVDEVLPYENVASCTFKEEEGSFLAGVLAGLMTETDTVGFLGGVEAPLIQKFQAGYEAGVKVANPEVKVIVKYTGDFEDVSKGKDLTNILFNQGADIVYHASGKCGLGAIQAAKNKDGNYYVIGVDSDQDYLGVVKDNEGNVVKTVVLTSMVKYVNVAIFDMCKLEADGEFKSGHYEYGIKEGGVGLSEMKYTKDKIPDDVIAKIEELKQKIIEGEIVVPQTLEEVKHFSVE